MAIAITDAKNDPENAKNMNWTIKPTTKEHLRGVHDELKPKKTY
jgi:hypothetical protein